MLCLNAQESAATQDSASDSAGRIAELQQKKLQHLRAIIGIYEARGEREKAVPYIERLVLLDPTDQKFAQILMRELCKQKRLDDMLDTYERLARANSDIKRRYGDWLQHCVYPICELCDEMYRQERWEELIPAYQRLIELLPAQRPTARRSGGMIVGRYHYCVMQLGWCYEKLCESLLERGEKERALKVLDVYRKSYNSYAAYDTVAVFLVSNGLLEEAKTILEEAVAGQFKKDFSILRELSDVYLKLDETDKAVDTFEFLVEHAKMPHYFSRNSVLGRLAVLCKKAGRFDTIEKHVMKILAADGVDRQSVNAAYSLISALGSTGDDKYSQLFMPFLDHPDPRVAGELVFNFTRGAPRDHYPPLVLKALESRRREVVVRAIAAISHKEPNPEVDKRIRHFFEGDDEDIKLEACSRLIRFYHDEDATLHVLGQVESQDRRRARHARFMICNQPIKTQPPPRAVLEKARSMLLSDDKLHREAAILALGMYQGEDVVQLLISALADREEWVVSPAWGRIVEPERDDEMVSRLLRNAFKRRVEEQKAVDPMASRIQSALRRIKKRQDQQPPEVP